jgi:FtsP/CotA-like multicopper oxidase with cupredoxin domain
MMTQRAVSIHWHGIFQNYTYYADGAEFITQCPIPPGQSFVYRFWALPVGTHWYHSHLASMRLDGLFGMLIVHREQPQIPYFPVSVNDWNHITSEELELGFVDRCENGASGPPYRIPGIQPGGDCSFEGAELDPTLYQSSLFDGRNRWNGNRVPLSEYVVKAGARYRFRMVNSGHVFPFLIQIDGHQLVVVASDGADIEPIVVNSLFITVAETIDFEVVADQSPGRYWIRADTQCPGDYARAILAYDGFQNDAEDPESTPTECTAESPCRVFNCPFGRYPSGSGRICIPMADARSRLTSQELADNYGIDQKDEDVIELFMNFAMVAGSSINGRRFMMPMTPLFQSVSTESNCIGEPCLNGCICQCTTIVTLPYDRTIRLVVSNLQPDPNVTQHM